MRIKKKNWEWIKISEIASDQFKEKTLEYLKNISISSTIIDEMASLMKDAKLTKEQVQYFADQVYLSYQKAMIVPMEPIGTVAAQSIGEPGTQMTLRTFHFAGVSEFSVTQGLPRLIEIVDARRNPSTPIMYVFLTEEFSKNRKKAREIHQKIEQIRVDSIAYDVEIDLADYSIVVYLDGELLEDKGLDIEDITKKLKKYGKKGSIDVRDENNCIIINPDLEDIQKLQKKREKILKTLISGIKGVKRGIIYKDNDTNEWMIQTEGTNLTEVLKIKGVDNMRTISNHIHEIEKIFGIEAAREIIIRESRQVLRDQGLDVDQRHLLAMADLMCYTGRILQIGRHGISGVKESILARAAFEVTIKQLINASVSGEEEKLKGIPENVIIGQLVPTIGTGAIKIQADLEKYREILQDMSKNA